MCFFNTHIRVKWPFNPRRYVNSKCQCSALKVKTRIKSGEKIKICTEPETEKNKNIRDLTSGRFFYEVAVGNTDIRKCVQGKARRIFNGDSMTINFEGTNEFPPGKIFFALSLPRPPPLFLLPSRFNLPFAHYYDRVFHKDTISKSTAK